MRQIVRSLFFGVLLWCVAGYSASSVFAQQPSDQPISDLESCFAYYQYGKVSVNLTAVQSAYSPGETGEVRGTIVNTNTFPLRNAMLYAHIRRVNTTSTFAQGGHYLIDRLTLVKDLNLLPGETKSITAQFPLKKTYPAGAYKLEYFIVSENGFHYAGRPFLEEDIAGSSLFDVRNADDPLVFFDVSKLEVNGETHHFRESITAYDADKLAFQLSILDRRDVKTDLPVTVSYYAFEDTLEAYQVSTKQVVIPKGKTTVSDTFTPPYTGAFVMVASITEPYATEIKYRFAKKGTLSHELRINDMGVTDFPASSSARAYVCIHSPARENTPQTTVTLQVLDANMKVVTEKKHTGSFTGALQALSVPLSLLPALDNFSVKAVVAWKDGTENKTKEIISHYDCATFQGSTTKIDARYDSNRRLLSIQPMGICTQAPTSNSVVESVRIVSEEGQIVKELYNKQLPVEVTLTDLPGGTYTAEWKNGTQSQVIRFAIVEVFTISGLLGQRWFLALLSGVFFLVLLILAKKYFVYRSKS